MAIIEAHHLSKTFQQHRRFPGFWGTIRTLFTHEYITRQAVGDISFTVERGYVLSKDSSDLLVGPI